jgi:glycosyltransferase involved in cell wall biosynthesis
MVIWVEAKNPALYSGGISIWLRSVVEILVNEQSQQVVLVGPDADKTSLKFGIDLKTLKVLWVHRLPRKISHFLYNFVSFRLLANILRPKLIFSPYFDVDLPKSIPSIVTVHDLCFLEVPSLYSSLQVGYYTRALRKSLNQASYVVTVSESTKEAIATRDLFPLDKILVIGNYLGMEFLQHKPTSRSIIELRHSFGNAPLIILYTGGYENRKNLKNLVESLRILQGKSSDFSFVVTGQSEKAWERLIMIGDPLRNRTYFTGYLDQIQLKDLYTAADVVVYPSFSEGFGRACIESMSVGTPLACSDIPAFREVASDYAEFFNPNNPSEIASSIMVASQSGRKKEIAQPDSPSDKEIKDFLEIVRLASSQG